MAYEWYDYGEREDGLRSQHSIVRYKVKPRHAIFIRKDAYGNDVLWHTHAEIKISKAEARSVMRQGYYLFWDWYRGTRNEIPVHLSDLHLIREEEVTTRKARELTPDDVAAPKRKKK